MTCVVATVSRSFLSTCSGPIILTILSPDAQSTMCFGTCTINVVNFATIISDSTFGRTSIIPFSSIRCPCRTTVFVGSKQRNPVRLDTILTVPKLFGFSHSWLAARSSSCVLVSTTNSGVASEAVSLLTSTFAFDVFVVSIGTGLELRSTNFFDYGKLPRIISTIKLIRRRMWTASLSTKLNTTFVESYPMRACTLTVAMTSIGFLEVEWRCKFSAACL